MPGPSGLGEAQGEAPKAWETSISHGKGGCRLTVGPGGSGQSMNLSVSVRLCEFSTTFETCQNPEEATAGWSADRLEPALSPGVMSPAATQDRLLCGGWWPFANIPSPEGG